MGKKKKKRTLGGVVKDIKTVAKSSAMLKPGVSGITSANSAAKRLAKDALNVTVGSSAAALIAKALKTNPGTIGKARPKKKK